MNEHGCFKTCPTSHLKMQHKVNSELGTDVLNLDLFCVVLNVVKILENYLQNRQLISRPCPYLRDLFLH